MAYFVYQISGLDSTASASWLTQPCSKRGGHTTTCISLCVAAHLLCVRLKRQLYWYDCSLWIVEIVDCRVLFRWIYEWFTAHQLQCVVIHWCRAAKWVWIQWSTVCVYGTKTDDIHGWKEKACALTQGFLNHWNIDCETCWIPSLQAIQGLWQSVL